MNKGQLLIYPLTKETMPLIRYHHMIKDYRLVKGITSKSLLQPDEDLSCLDGGSFLEQYPINEISAADCNESSLLVDDNAVISEGAFNKLLSGFHSGEEVIIHSNTLKNDSLVQGKFRRVKKISVPVIFVMGMGENSYKFNIQLSLRDFFLTKGYKVSQLGSKNYSSLFGFAPLPEFLYSDKLSAEKKIFMFNQLVYNLVEGEEPDLLILGIPGAIMKYDEGITNHFGEIAFIMSHAIPPDITILSLYYGVPSPDYLKKMKLLCHYQLDCDLDFIHIANTRFVVQPDDSTHEVEYITVAYKDIAAMIENLGMDEEDLFNIFDETSVNRICEKIETMLQNNYAYI